MAKAKQTGPPVRIGAYQLSVTVMSGNLLARAVLVDKTERNLPCGIYISDKDIAIDVESHSDLCPVIPHEVTMALLKMAGWKVEYPDSMNPNMKGKEPGQ